MRSHHLTLETHVADFWLARGAIVLIAGLQLLFLNNNLPFGPRWLAPGLEIAMLAPLSLATSWTRQQFRRASTDEHFQRIAQRRKIIRVLSLILTGAVMIINTFALVAVVRALMHGAKGGQSLLIDAMNIWFTNVVIFALWYWNIDLGGAVSRGLHGDKSRPDFLFPQMLGSGDRDPDWSPGFIRLLLRLLHQYMLFN